MQQLRLQDSDRTDDDKFSGQEVGDSSGGATERSDIWDVSSDGGGGGGDTGGRRRPASEDGGVGGPGLVLFMSHKKSHNAPPKPKYVFLTEAAATCKGTFTDKFRESRESKHLPRGHGGQLQPIKAHTSLGYKEDSDLTDRLSGGRNSGMYVRGT
jgi:hypothetical protein